MRYAYELEQNVERKSEIVEGKLAPSCVTGTQLQPMFGGCRESQADIIASVVSLR